MLEVKCSINLFQNFKFIIHFRGLLTKLLAAPYEKKSDFMFTVIYFKKTWYLIIWSILKLHNLKSLF